MSKRKNGGTVNRAQEYPGTLADFLSAYTVYPALTSKLDGFSGYFAPEIINEIVLWKLSRYVSLPQNLLTELDGTRMLKPKCHRQAQKLVTALQMVKGIQLPMASTFLRFANPEVFQMIDRHAYRALYGISFNNAQKAKRTENSRTLLYFDYLDALHDLCDTKHILFRNADRILFEFDRRQNPPLVETI